MEDGRLYLKNRPRINNDQIRNNEILETINPKLVKYIDLGSSDTVGMGIHISDYTGIEIFTEVESIVFQRILNGLYCPNTNCYNEDRVYKLDLSNNKKLKSFVIANGRYIRADNDTSVLTSGNCGNSIYNPPTKFYDTSITPSINLDLSNNKDLETLIISDMNISSINLSGLYKLTRLSLPLNSLKSIDLSENPNLKVVNLDNNPIESVVFSGNNKLIDFQATRTKLRSLDFTKSSIKKARLCNNPDLTLIKLNPDFCLEISDLDYVNPNQIVECKYNFNASSESTPAIELKGLSAFKSIALENKSLLGVFSPEKRTYVPDDNFEQALIDLGFDNKLDDYVYDEYVENITSLLLTKSLQDAGAGAQWEEIDTSKKIKSLEGIQSFKQLRDLHINNHLIETIDLTKNLELKRLELVGNKLKSIDISKNIKLYSNQLELGRMESLKCVKVDSGWYESNKNALSSAFSNATASTSDCPSD